jgi:hypothetical protein
MASRTPAAVTRRVAVALLIAAVGIPAGLRAQSSPPRTGRWELDLQKSTFNPGPGPRQQTRVDRQTPTGLEATVTGITGTGMEINYRYAPSFGGSDVPIMGTGVPSGGDSIAVRLIDERTIESILRRAGMVVLTRTEVVSADGRMLTITSRGVDPSGAAASNVTVYNRR